MALSRCPRAAFALLLAVVVSSTLGLAAQDAGPAPDTGTAQADADLVTQTLPLDIATASFYELADWLRSLGLPDSGSIAELKARLYEHYGVSAPAVASPGRVITIERAVSAEYFKIEGNEGSVIRVSGGVVLTVRDDASEESQRLEADEIVYDKDANAVTARGHVHYLRTKGSTSEEFTGQTLSVDLDDWSGVFLDGKLWRSGSTASSTPADTPAAAGSGSGQRGFSFEADTILKRSGSLLVLDNGIITACDADNPHFSIRAKRLWLLGSNEWAIADAVLSLGEVPMVWIPFFFYPGEEIVFHPVLGYRDREGRFLQTTTYIIGAKPKSEKSSILSFAQGNSEGKKELRGVFLKPMEGETAAASNSSLKVLADVYSSLGACIGLVGNFPTAGPFEGLKFTVEAGLSRSIFTTTTGTGYSPYIAAAGWESVWNESRIFSGSLPIRYAFDLSTTIKPGIGSATISLPFYSDRYFTDDFGDRSEDMDWIGLSDSSTTTSSTTISSFTQKLQWSYSLKPSILSPWISSISVNKLALSMAWLSKENSTLKASESLTLFNADPSRYFFYPSIMRPLDVSLSLKGSLLPSAAGTPKSGDDGAAGGGGLVLKAPWEAEEGEGAAGQSGSASKVIPDFRLAKRVPSFPAAGATASSPPFSLNWTLDPTAYVEQRFLSDEWSGPDAVDLSELLYSLVSYHLSSSLVAAYSRPDGLVSGSLSLGWVSQDQNRTTTDDTSYSSLVSSYLLTDYEYRLAKLTSALKLSTKPFTGFWPLSPTTLSYNLEGYLYEYSYDSLDGSTPVYETLYPAWDSTMISTHAATISFGLRTGSSTQSLGLSMSLPPTTEAYTGSLSLAASPGGWKLTASLKSRMYRSSSLLSFSFDPVAANFALAAPFGLTLSDSLAYDASGGIFKSNTATLGWGPVSASLAAAQGYYYYPVIDDPILGSGWVAASSEESFVFSSFKMAFDKTWKSPENAPYSASIGVAASFTQSLLQFSDSVLGLSLNIGFKVSKFIDLSFKSVSQNSAAWRYCPWLFPAIEKTGQTADYYFRNPVVDIFNGFAFWDSSLRTASLFKLKSLSISMTHDLHDWDLTFSLTATPTLDTSVTPHKYVLESEFSILLAWKDLSQIKASLSKDSEGYSF